MTLKIRAERTGDSEAIWNVHAEAFGSDDEARLVDVLRRERFTRVSLVAEIDKHLVGHILFSDLSIDTSNGLVKALSLAPMAVRSSHQRQGIGSALVRRGLEVCTAGGHTIVIVVGHTHFYPRFGFSAALVTLLESEYSGESFMAVELRPHALCGITGRVVYPPPFAGF